MKKKIKERINNKLRFQKGYGGILLILLIIGVLFWLLFFPKFPPYDPSTNPPGTPRVSQSPFCKPDNDPDPPTVEGYDYAERLQDIGGGQERYYTDVFDGQGGRALTPLTFVRIKKDVPISEKAMTGNPCNDSDSGDDCSPINADLDDHFLNHDPYVAITPFDGKLYSPQYPQGEGGNFSTKFPGLSGTPAIIKYSDYKMVFLVHTKTPPYPTPPGRVPGVTGDKEYIDIKGTLGIGRLDATQRFWITDIYIDQNKKDSLPSDILDCQDVVPTGAAIPLPTSQVPGVTITNPPQNKTPGGKHLQLEYFLVGSIPVEGSLSLTSWYTPQCKPTIYLYPEQKIDVHVQVQTKGFLTYTDPKYPTNGWHATAYPNGTINVGGKNYDYLYYESKIHDSLVTKPEKGYVVRFDELSSLYDRLLPQLGLLGNQIQEFKDYWQKALPFAPYYFVGIMKQEDINTIEQLTIDPAPATIIRARLYFEALDRFKIVEPPTITSPARSGFTVVEWGGMVKSDPNNPFTCSQ